MNAMTEARRTFAVALLVVVLATALYAVHPAFFFKDDFQLQYLPGSAEVARGWMNGTVPLLTRFSWVCTSLGAEYQFGVFSVFRAMLDILVWLLPLSLTARGAMLFIVHAAVAAAGGYRLARSYGATPGAATMTGLVAGLNGWILWWATTWFPAVASFAWLPWYWLALRGIARGDSRWSWAGAAISLYLLIAAGWPYSVLMAVAVAVMHIVTAMLQQRWRIASVQTGASLLGLALAAPAVLMLLEYFPYTARTAVATTFEATWYLPLGSFFGLVLPSFSVLWPVFAGWWSHPAVELLGAFVPLAATAAAFGRGFVRRHAPELALLFVLLLLLLMPSAGPFRWSFRWLPLFHLTLAVLGAAVIGQQRRRVAYAGLVLIAMTALAALAFDHELRITLLHAAPIATLCVFWAYLERRGSRIAEWMPAAISAVMIVMTFLAFAPRPGEVPVWDADASLLAPGPLDPTRRYLALYEFADVYEQDADFRFTRGTNVALRPGNIPMYAGLHFVNGYSPLGLAALKNLFHFNPHGPLDEEKDARRILERETGPSQLLDHLGVNGLVVRESLAREYAPLLASYGWRPAARIASCIVLHRGEAAFEPIFAPALAMKGGSGQQIYAVMLGRRISSLPVVLFTPGTSDVTTERYGPRVIGQIEESRHHTSFVVRGKGPKSLIVFRRPWLPGFRATIGGAPLPVLRAGMVLPAVEIPPDAEGEVRLVYRPRALVAGAWIAALALVMMAGVTLRKLSS